MSQTEHGLEPAGFRSRSRRRPRRPRRPPRPRRVGASAVLAVVLALGAVPVLSFEYRGQIKLGGEVPSGALDVLFTVFDNANDGRSVGAPFLAEGVAVQGDGSFVVDVELGRLPGAQPLWLEVHILRAGALGPFEALKPRRALSRTSSGQIVLATVPSALVPAPPTATVPAANPPPAAPATIRRSVAGPIPSLPIPPRPVTPPGVSAGPPTTASDSLLQGIRSASSSAPLYTEFGWQGSSGPDTSDFATGDKVLRVTDAANTNVFEVDFDHLQPGTVITGIPITINEPGHYYLISNLSNTVNNADGITIDADNVTIDMNGYTLYGEVFTGINADDGIFVSGSQTNIKIYNGAVIGWGGDGINGLNADFSIWKDLHVSLNEGDGLVTDFNNVMERITAFSNGLDGIEGDDGSIIYDCTAGQNDDNGIQTSEGGLVVDSSSYDNRVDGFDVNAGSVVKNCSASDNGTFGFDIALGGSSIENTAYNNQSNGFDMASACILRDCISSENQGHGVRTFANSWVTDSHFHGNFFDGMRISSTDCHIENNLVTENGRNGIAVTSSGSFIVRNAAHGNQTNFAFVNNNAHGPIVDVGGIGDLTNDPAAAHPWANFSF